MSAPIHFAMSDWSKSCEALTGVRPDQGGPISSWLDEVTCDACRGATVIFESWGVLLWVRYAVRQKGRDDRECIYLYKKATKSFSKTATRAGRIALFSVKSLKAKRAFAAEHSAP